MIAVDTSTWVAFLQADSGEDVALLDHALQDQQLLMVPAVLAEVLAIQNYLLQSSQPCSNFLL